MCIVLDKDFDEETLEWRDVLTLILCGVSFLRIEVQAFLLLWEIEVWLLIAKHFYKLIVFLLVNILWIKLR